MSSERPRRATYLRYTDGASDKVYHVLEYQDKVVAKYGRFGSKLRQVVYPHHSNGPDKAWELERAKKRKGYEEYQPPTKYLEILAGEQNPNPPKPAPKPVPKPVPKADAESAPGIKGNLAPSENDHPMAKFLF